MEHDAKWNTTEYYKTCKNYTVRNMNYWKYTYNILREKGSK